MWLAKTKVTTSYLYLAKKLGAEVDQFHEVSDLVPLDRGGFEVHSRESCFRVARGIRPCSARNLVCAEAFDASEPSGAELGAPGASQESRRCKHKSRSDPAVGCTAGIGTLDSHAAGGGDTRASVNAGVCVASASDVLVAKLGHRSVVDRAAVWRNRPVDLFCRGCGNSRGACWRPDPRRLASTLGWSVA